MQDIVSEEKYSELLALQERVNAKLRQLFEANKHIGREYLSKILVNEVESIVKHLNAEEHNFGRADYSGDINYENSEQTYSDGQKIGEAVVLHFCGFSVQASWSGADKY
ncbi:MAG: hypothetical protein ACKVH8_10100 [Pirellulales bacterium]